MGLKVEFEPLRGLKFSDGGMVVYISNGENICRYIQHILVYVSTIENIYDICMCMQIYISNVESICIPIHVYISHVESIYQY